jgi:hypothetical protein
MRMRNVRASWVIGALCVLAYAPGAFAADPWAIPPEGSCEPGPSPAGSAQPDATPFPFRVGEVLNEQKTDVLKPFLPEELWANRDRFFYDGMQLEIGPCYRNYAPPEFFEKTTQRFRGQARLVADGSLENYQAGLPFPPDTIDPNDPQAALRWAWNWVSRYRAGGSFGEFQISLLARDLQQRFTGEYFFVPLARRADREGDGFRFPAPLAADWAAGGESRNSDTSEECKFRQYGAGKRQPDLFVWIAAARKVRRATAPDSEFALIACLADASLGGGLFLHGESPALHHWKVLGVRDLLAPINARVPAYPVDKLRGFGPAGVSFASDRWELRRAIVLEGRFKEGSFGDGVSRYIWYLDLQTLFPLYYAAYRSDSQPGGLGVFIGRWSEDRADYPHWADDPARPVRVLDQVGSGLIDWNKQDAVRAEAWQAVSIPSDEKKLVRKMSQSSLSGH